MVLANTNVHTYEAAPVFTLVERAVIARLAALVGPSWASEHDGLFVPGGSIATLYSAQPCNDFWREEEYQHVCAATCLRDMQSGLFLIQDIQCYGGLCPTGCLSRGVSVVWYTALVW